VSGELRTSGLMATKAIGHVLALGYIAWASSLPSHGLMVKWPSMLALHRCQRAIGIVGGLAFQDRHRATTLLVEAHTRVDQCARAGMAEPRNLWGVLCRVFGPTATYARITSSQRHGRWDYQDTALLAGLMRTATASTGEDMGRSITWPARRGHNTNGRKPDPDVGQVCGQLRP